MREVRVELDERLLADAAQTGSAFQLARRVELPLVCSVQPRQLLLSFGGFGEHPPRGHLPNIRGGEVDPDRKPVLHLGEEHAPVVADR